MNRDKKYAYAAVVGAFLLWSATGGIYSNCRGIFFNPVATTLGVPLSQLNLAGIVSGLACAAGMPLFCSIYHKRQGGLFLRIMAYTYCASQYLLGYTTTLGWFFIMSIIQSVSAGFINMYVIQSVASAWFPHKKGTVLGLISLAPSLAGIIMNPMITGWIQDYGWQSAYRIIGVIVTVLITVTMVILRHDPAVVGCQCITGNAAPSAAAADPTHSTLTHVLLAAVCVSVIAILNALAQHLANYAILAGRDAAFGAAMVSCTMIGSTIAKFIMGPLNDRIGARTTTLVTSIMVIAACCGLLVTDSSIVMYLCSLFVGLLLALSALEIPLICRNCMTPAMYRKFFPRISSLNTMLSASSAGILSFLLNINNTYAPVLIFSIGILILMCLCVVALEVLHRADTSAAAI